MSRFRWRFPIGAAALTLITVLPVDAAPRPAPAPTAPAVMNERLALPAHHAGVTATPAAADTGTIAVSGTARVSLPTDRARVRFAVETEAPTASGAVTANAEAMDAALSALREVIGDAGKLETSGYNLNPVYRQPPRDQGGEPRIVGYRALNHVVATLTDVERVGAVLDAAVGAGVNRVASLSFYAEDTRPARLEALAEASRRAHEEARVLADALGVALGAPLRVNTSGDARPMVREEFQMMRADMAAAAPTPIEAGEQEVVVTVSITYLIDGGPAR
jgi:hypothetical protein